VTLRLTMHTPARRRLVLADSATASACLRRSRNCLVGLLVILASAACSGPALPAAPNVILVGVSLPLTGTDAVHGVAMQEGYARAVEEVNAAGGLELAGGRRVPVKLLVRDDRSQTPIVEEHAGQFARDGVHLLLATYSDVRAAAQAVAADGLGCPYVANSTDAAGLPGKRMTWVFSVPVEGADLRTRAHHTAQRALSIVGRAGGVDPSHLRIAFAGM
jgi:ABC-type branched-subunit amino acid transport system substrate-binding protein